MIAPLTYSRKFYSSLCSTLSSEYSWVKYWGPFVIVIWVLIYAFCTVGTLVIAVKLDRDLHYESENRGLNVAMSIMGMLFALILPIPYCVFVGNHASQVDKDLNYFITYLIDIPALIIWGWPNIVYNIITLTVDEPLKIAGFRQLRDVIPFILFTNVLWVLGVVVAIGIIWFILYMIYILIRPCYGPIRDRYKEWKQKKDEKIRCDQIKKTMDALQACQTTTEQTKTKIDMDNLSYDDLDYLSCDGIEGTEV